MGAIRPPLETHWGGNSLARGITQRPLDDDPVRNWNSRRSELVQRLLAEACERCGSTHKVEVHHMRALKDLNPKVMLASPRYRVRLRCPVPSGQ
ncbi:HNH endonuclease [Nocardia sp. NBC_01730]|uniref:HNH endonuclease n=1 Tax=Nocardia sp. NBC_01730 TaxID=2975998 RepID=UPI003FA378D2